MGQLDELLIVLLFVNLIEKCMHPGAIPLITLIHNWCSIDPCIGAMAAWMGRGPCQATRSLFVNSARWLNQQATHPYLLLACLSFVAYSPSLRANLVFDDRPAIVDNEDVRSPLVHRRLWSNDYWGTPLHSVSELTQQTTRMQIECEHLAGPSSIQTAAAT